MKPLIDQAFWSDQEIERASSTVKLAALWLITNSQTNLIGVCGASEARFVFETGLKPEALQRALEALPKSFVKVGDVIFVRNYIRHQFGAGDKLVRNNFFTSLSSLFLAVKNPELKALILEQYPEFLECSERAYQGLTKPKDGKDREVKEKGRVQRGEASIPTSEESLAFAGEIALSPEECSAFMDHFQSNGWRVGGKTPMRDWKAAMRGWQRNVKAGTFRNGTTSARSKSNPNDPNHKPY